MKTPSNTYESPEIKEIVLFPSSNVLIDSNLENPEQGNDWEW